MVGMLHQLSLAKNIMSINMVGSRMLVKHKLKSLGVTIDSHLQFDSHANKVARVCNFHTLHHVCGLLTKETAQTVECSVVASWLDYCNSPPYCALAEMLNKLQQVQNNLARVICQCNG